MKESLTVLVALTCLALPWFRDESEAAERSAISEAWDGTGMPPDERFEDWS
jgi:hypothetical protein